VEVGISFSGNFYDMSDDPIYDVAVIGGGLAGLCLAIKCARAHHRVILFEKEHYPFHKVCGEYVSFESSNFLLQLGLDLTSLNLPVIKKLEVSDVKGRTFAFNLPMGGFGVSRFLLDNSLYQIALANGVKVCTNSKVNEAIFNGGIFEIWFGNRQVLAKTAVAAYGKRSNLDIRWKRPFTTENKTSLNNYIGIKYHVRGDQDVSTIALHNFFNGYCGFSKIEDGRSCLCYLTTAENLNSCGNSIKEMEQKILCKNPRLKEIFTKADFLYKEPLAISQISFSRKSQIQDHILMTGDAAGMISPLCGNGMSMAMHAAKLASESIERYLEKKISREMMENEYELNWKKAFSRRLWVGRKVQMLFGGDTSTSLFIKTVHSVPLLSRWLIQSTHGSSF
jgi:flavin-dependent dehydrogenase